MYVSCYDLMNMPSFKNIQLVAGESGLDRKVSWVYVLQTPSLKDWIYGGEFMFIVNNIDIHKILEEAVSYGIAGVVVLKNENNESFLTDDVINFANKESLPLFEMDYNIKILDITRDISTFILHKQENVDYLNYFFYNILFSEKLSKRDIDDFKLNFRLLKEDVCFVSTIQSKDISKLNNIHVSFQMYTEDTDYKFLSMILNNSIVILTFTNTNLINKAKKFLKSSFVMLNEKYSDVLFLGVGNTCTSMYDIKYSYEKAVGSISLCSNEKNTIDYDELGFSRLLLNTIHEEDLNEYATFILGKIKEYDDKNQSFFLQTMEVYILCNGNINKASSQLFVHRNTCIYRIAKIKELFQIDLDDPYTRADVLNCLTIYKFLG